MLVNCVEVKKDGDGKLFIPTDKFDRKPFKVNSTLLKKCRINTILYGNKQVNIPIFRVKMKNVVLLSNITGV
jgi:hypothetical protein